MYAFSHEFHTFPVTEGNEIQHIYSRSRPPQESSPTTQNLNIPTQRKMQILKTSSLFVTSDQRILKTQPRKTGILRNALINLCKNAHK